jgi:hypothetical protein
MTKEDFVIIASALREDYETSVELDKLFRDRELDMELHIGGKATSALEKLLNNNFDSNTLNIIYDYIYPVYEEDKNNYIIWIENKEIKIHSFEELYDVLVY